MLLIAYVQNQVAVRRRGSFIASRSILLFLTHTRTSSCLVAHLSTLVYTHSQDVGIAMESVVRANAVLTTVVLSPEEISIGCYTAIQEALANREKALQAEPVE
jgi:hypothetical protein